MCENRTRMNDSKTDVIMFGNKIQSKKSETSGIRVGQEDTKLHICRPMKFFCAHLDESLDFKTFIRHKCKTAANNLRLIGKIRNHVNKKNTEQLVNSLVTSVLDYGNAILCGLPYQSLNELQRIQNWAAKLVIKHHRMDRSTTSRKLLHWLPVFQYQV